MADKIVVLNGGHVEQVGRPLDLYDRPTNKFVASFIGSPAMNLIDCKVTNIASETAEISLGASRLTLPARDGLSVGQSISLGVRPEHLSLAEEGLEAKVRVVEPTGSEIHVVFQFQDQDITAIFRDRHTLAPGDIVHLAVDLAQAHLFDGQTGYRLD